MNNAMVAVMAFIAGNVAGFGVMFATGDLSSPPPEVLQPIPDKVPVPIPTPVPVPTPTPANTVVAAAGSTGTAAPVAPTPTPEPKPQPTPATGGTTGTTVAAITPDPKPQPKPQPPHDDEPMPPYGRLVIAGAGPGSLSVSADKTRTGNKVLVPLNKPDGAVTAKSPDGVFTIDIRYKTDGDTLKASVDVSPMALITGGGQTATHLSGVALGKAPTKIDIGGGAAGSFSFILSHLK
jgi:hypothetical protein